MVSIVPTRVGVGKMSEDVVRVTCTRPATVSETRRSPVGSKVIPAGVVSGEVGGRS